MTKESKQVSIKEQEQEQGPVNLDLLVGNAEEMGKENLASCVLQLFLSNILNEILSDQQEIVSLAFEIIHLVVTQGLAHPLLVFYFTFNSFCIVCSCYYCHGNTSKL